MNKKIVAIVVVLLIAAALAYAVHPRGKREDEGVLRISGNVEVTEVQVSFKIPGRVAQRAVDEGALVKKGDLVARLDDAELKQALDQASAEAEAAGANLAELQAGSRREEIAEGEAQLERTQAEAIRLEADYQRAAALYRKEVIPKAQLDQARAARDSQVASVRERKEALQLLRKGPRRERIDEAKARLKQAQAVVANAQERLGYATLTAPLTGMVLSKGIEPGEQVAAGTPVITVGDMGDTWVKGYIPEAELGRVKLGQRARVLSDSYPGKSFEGKVSFISSEAEFTPKNVQTEKERVKLVYRVKISIPNQNQALKPGMPVDAEILVGG
ncbi:efflux RND transporter periplasmic adaptor subunit [Geomesophilobacter sediminis]|uniref:Efflux RND transporter periplasmic adaptor subunit n=1 Tax=Geomesophilobacter sediminis TaxID=2798584 RepID=A0A8J7M1D1_9BACT|nr:efflux RND transporter periplasmic adaptor subunit [Geomesophilobacter sediminis]MBJ6726890.1 efflux RND transporter periplasmic adaptor subunit [Geomesophilobacter sediminis]